jgi:hypothetical protein
MKGTGSACDARSASRSHLTRTSLTPQAKMKVQQDDKSSSPTLPMKSGMQPINKYLHALSAYRIHGLKKIYLLYFWALISYLRVQENKLLCRDQVLKLSTRLWQILQQTSCGFKSYWNELKVEFFQRQRVSRLKPPIL